MEDIEVIDTAEVIQSGWTILLSASSTTRSSGQIIVVARPPLYTNGTFKLRLKANSVQSDSRATANNSPASDLDTDFLTVTTENNIRFGNAGGETLVGTIHSAYPLTSITSSDFEIISQGGQIQSGWSIVVSSSSLSVSAPCLTSYGFLSSGSVTITATPPANTNLIVRMRIKEKSLLSTTALVPRDVLNATYFASVNNTTGSDRVPISWGAIRWIPPISDYSTFNARGVIRTTLVLGDAAGLDSRDIEVLNSSNTIQSGWITPTIAILRNPILNIFPPTSSYIRENFKLRLKANSLSKYEPGQTHSVNSPLIDLDSDEVFVDNGPIFHDHIFTTRQINTSTSFTRSFYTRGPAISGITSADFEIINSAGQLQSGWTVSPSASSLSAGSTSSLTLTVSPPAGANDVYRIRLKANSITIAGTTGPADSVVSGQIIVNRTSNLSYAPIIRFPDASGSLTLWMYGESYHYGLFSQDSRCYETQKIWDVGILEFIPWEFNPFSFQNTDLEVIDDSDTPISQSGWIIETYTDRFYSESYFQGGDPKRSVINALPPPGVNANFRIRLKANSLYGEGYTSGTGNIPRQPLLSTARKIDNRLPIRATSFTLCTGSQTRTTSSFILDLSHLVPITEITASSFTVTSNATITNQVPTTTSIRIQLDSKMNGLSASADLEVTNPVVTVSTLTPLASTNTDLWDLTFSRTLTDNEINSIVIARKSTSSKSAFTVTKIKVANQYNITATSPTNASGTYTVTFNSNTISDGVNYRTGPTFTSISPSIAYDTRYPVITVTSFLAQVQSQSTSIFQLTLSNVIPSTELTSSDFTISLATATFSSISPIVRIYLSRATRDLQPSNISLSGEPSGVTVTRVETIYSQPTNLWALVFSRVLTPAEQDLIIITVTGRVSQGTSQETSLSGVIVSRINLRIRLSNSTPGSTNNNISGLQTSNLTLSDQPIGVTVSQVIPIGDPSTDIWDLVFSSSLTLVQRNAISITLTGSTSSGTALSTYTISQIYTNFSQYHILIANPTAVRGSYTVTLSANSISTGTDYRAGPAAAAPSTSVNYDTRSQVAVSSFTAPDGTQSGTTSTFRLTLDRRVSTGEITVTDFTAAGGASISSVAAVGTQATSDRYDIVVTNPTNRTGCAFLPVKT